MSETPSLFVSDLPCGESPAFNFPRVIRTMRDFIASAPADAPLNICVSGGWGTGKTTLLSGLEEAFASDPESNGEANPSETKYLTIWFAPWKLASEEEVRNALARKVLEVIENDGSFSTKAQIGIERKNVLRMLSQRLLQVNPDEVSSFHRADTRTRETFVEVEEIFQRVAEVYLHDPQQPRRLVIFVDDLDRCRPERMTEVLESIKLFFDLPGLIFIFALNSNQLERAVAIDYQMTQEEAREYLEKIFQLTVELPRKGAADLREFLESTLEEIGVELKNERLSSAIVERFGRNLRNLKLFINSFSFQRRLTGEVESVDEDAHFRWLYLDSTMRQSMTTSLKGGSSNLLLALEFLAHGGFLHDEELRSRYLDRLSTSHRNYAALIAYSIVSKQDDVELPKASLDIRQQEMIDALHSDGEVAPTMKVMREGKPFIDSDLRQMIYQARSEDIDTNPTSEGPGVKRKGVLSWGNPFTSQEWNQLGDKLLAVPRLVDAYLCYLLSTLMDPSAAAYLCDLARIFGRTSQYNAAKDLLAQGFELEPTAPYVLVEIAYYYDILLVDEDTGSLLYREALVHNSTNPSTPYYLAMNLSKEGQHKDAYLAYVDACLKDPENESKLSRLPQYARDAGLLEEGAPGSIDDLKNELAAAIKAGQYPLSLSEEERRTLRERVTARPDPELVAAELSRPPF